MAGLIGIGVGPGDADLLTVKAVRAINDADIIMCPASAPDRPSIALSVVSDLINAAQEGEEGETKQRQRQRQRQRRQQEIIKLIFPMTKDRDILEETWRRNADIMAQKVATGKNIVYLTVGDPYLYSTWIYMHRHLSEKHPEMSISVIPGIVSMFSFASKVGVSIAEGAEKVAVIPSCYDMAGVKEIAKHAESMIFLKDGRYFDQVIQVLRESGFGDDSVFAIGQSLGTDQEVIQKMTLGQVDDADLGSKYFSILVVKRVN